MSDDSYSIDLRSFCHCSPFGVTRAQRLPAAVTRYGWSNAPIRAVSPQLASQLNERRFNQGGDDGKLLITVD